MSHAILFDIDGTLADSNNFHVLAWAEALHAAGHDFRLSRLHDLIGMGSDNYVPALLPDANSEEVRRLGDEHGRLLKSHYLRRIQAFPRARDLLQRCKDEGLAVFLATSARKAEVEHHLDTIGIRDVINGYVDADDVDRSKPCPDVFEAALRKAGVSAADALVVGDSPFDIEAATAAGIRTVAVRSGLFTDEQLAGALAIYDDAADLLARFEDSPLTFR